jgi:hypothetical protein
MKTSRLPALKFFALLFLLPGLAGLITSAVISAHYLDILPRWPSPEVQRIIPREIHGTTVYQTVKEDQKLNVIEYSSVGVFLLGLVIGVIYLEQWGAAQSRGADEESRMTEGFR